MRHWNEKWGNPSLSIAKCETSKIAKKILKDNTFSLQSAVQTGNVPKTLLITVK